MGAERIAVMAALGLGCDVRAVLRAGRPVVLTVTGSLIALVALGVGLIHLLGIPLALWIGSGALLDGPLFVPVILLGGIMIGTGHAAVISITSIYYPSAVRSTGGGWASFMAKFAAVAAPILGGWYFLGSDTRVLAAMITADPTLGEPLVEGLPYLRAEAVHAVRAANDDFRIPWHSRMIDGAARCHHRRAVAA
jgi:hypothetical protein